VPCAERGFAEALERERSRQLDAREATAQEPPLTVRTLGTTQLSRAGARLEDAWLSRRAGQLFKFLLAERGRTVKVDEIAESVWPGSDYQSGARVRYYVHVLRRALEPQRPIRSQSGFVICTGGGYILDMARVELDADVFEAQTSAALALRGRDPAAAGSQLERALELYRGEFMADELYASWAVCERQRLHELACEGLASLAQIRTDEQRLAAAAAALVRLAALQPYDEDVHRRLIGLDLRLGRRSDALRRYAALRSRLRREFGEDPGFTPAELSRSAADAGEDTGLELARP
jgi:DNA-binding SARP family transcriptional activator